MDFEHDITKLCHDGSHYVIITRVTSWIRDFIVWWPVWVHRCDIMPRPWFQSDRVPSDRSRCTVGFGWPASVYLYSRPLLDQNVRLFSISDVKTCCFIIRYRRLTLDSLKIRFFVQIVFWPRFTVREVWIEVQWERKTHWHAPRTKQADFSIQTTKFR